MKVTEKKAALAALYRELEAGQKEIETGGVTQSRGEELEAKAKEAETLQAEVEQYERITALATKGREVDHAILPPARGTASSAPSAAPVEAKGVGADGSPIVGFVPIGDAFVRSPEFKSYVANGMQAGTVSAPVQFKGVNEPYIEVTQKMLETKAIPTLGADVIRLDRVGIVSRAVQPDRLRLRDLLNVSQTSATSVEYLTETAIPIDAAMVAEAGTKPETTAGYDTANAPVRTIAVWQPVTEQQLADVPQIANLLNNRMMYQLKKQEERQFMYGSGAGQNLQGILTLGGVPAITRTVVDTTNLDRIRIGITDVLVAGYEPNAVAIHPVDWEAIVLLKATDKNYIWTVVTDAATGNSRVWGLQVVETVAMKAPTTTQRYLLVGDFQNGATIWDRQQATAQVGWINDQFITNQRTLRVEERLAFGVTAPLAFAKYETAAAA